MQNSSLSEHKFQKGKFITPFNEVFNDMGIFKENPWFHIRMPEYIWLGLVIKHYGRECALDKCILLLRKLCEYRSSISVPKFSNILGLPNSDQINIYTQFTDIIDKEVLSPLTIIFTHTNYPCFASFFHTEVSIEKRIEVLNDIMIETSDHQSNLSTDLRFLVIIYLLLTDTLCMSRSNFESLLEYPTLSHNDRKMETIRPFIRSLEIGLPEENNYNYINLFWEEISKLSECKLFSITANSNHANAEQYITEVKHKLEFYTALLTSNRPLDNRMLVILGIATYSYKRILEVVKHKLYQTIAGRSVVRVLIENYIMLKYLLKNESSHNDIWTEYQYYGIGQYKLISERFIESENDLHDSHVNYGYIDLLVGEYKNKEFIDMDTTYFGKKNIREKAKDVGEKSLYGLFYDYDSAFEHGLWGAIRESSLLKCESAAHQYHCVPDIENVQKLNDIWHDCVENMDRILAILKEEYGLPDSFNEEKK